RRSGALLLRAFHRGTDAGRTRLRHPLPRPGRPRLGRPVTMSRRARLTRYGDVSVHVVGIADPDTGGPVARNDYLRRCAAGGRPGGVSGPIAELISRDAPVASIMNAFYWNLVGVSRATPYPAQEITRAMARI